MGFHFYVVLGNEAVFSVEFCLVPILIAFFIQNLKEGSTQILSLRYIQDTNKTDEGSRLFFPFVLSSFNTLKQQMYMNKVPSFYFLRGHFSCCNFKHEWKIRSHKRGVTWKSSFKKHKLILQSIITLKTSMLYFSLNFCQLVQCNRQAWYTDWKQSLQYCIMFCK